MHTDYKSSQICQLRDQQVRFAPVEKRVSQAARAEKLLNEIDESLTYSYEFICFRVTDFRPTESDIETMTGKDAIADLHRLIEDLTDSADVFADKSRRTRSHRGRIGQNV